MKVFIYTDGASRGNPGHASFGFVIFDESGKMIYEEGKYLGYQTNNVAEYQAVLNALEYVKNNLDKVENINFFADSRLVVEQLSGRFKIKNQNLKILVDQIKNLETKLGKVAYTHIYREENKQADRLANIALDKALHK